MGYQMTFKRYELKYLLTRRQKEALLKVMEPYMALDQYGRTTICNLYFDTDTYRLARRSIEKPDYKEKLRVRSYGTATEHSPVFVELKKKYDSVVYKRRLSLPEHKAVRWLSGEAAMERPTQISGEIDYFRSYYGDVHPVVFLSYEREAYFDRNGGDFRVTFDDNILAREEALSLQAGAWGTPLLDDAYVLMELKTAGSLPLWMVRFLSENHIYKTSFSKYGRAYETLIYPALNRVVTHPALDAQPARAYAPCTLDLEGGRLYA